MAGDDVKSRGGRLPTGQRRTMKIQKAPNDALALTNCAIVSYEEFDESVQYVVVQSDYAMTLKRDRGIQKGDLGTASLQRRWIGLSLNEEVTVTTFDPHAEEAYIGTLVIHADFLSKSKRIEDFFDTKEMEVIFKKLFMHQVFSVGQLLALDFHGINLMLKVDRVELVDVDLFRSGRFVARRSVDEADRPTKQRADGDRSCSRGVLMPQTSLQFDRALDSAIRLRGSKIPLSHPMVQPNFSFEDLGIGGLDREFGAIFRRAFASRIFPASLVAKLGVKHVRGILLFGPPGTGKTLIARQIGKMLNAKEPKIVNGPEILNKYVGQSEENIRLLFKDAEAEYKQRGDQSDLHIVIFDEIDAICRQRGSRSDTTGVGDSMVNQLLAKLDGVEQLNNILVIGMTNRLDMIDEALLRPGRMEVQMEIGLPDENGRIEILKIHTASMTRHQLLENDVIIEEFAPLTKNFSGAEIEGLVKSATSFAFNRHVKAGTLAGVSEDYENLKVNRDDFLCALNEVKPAFGVAEGELETCVSNGIINYGVAVQNVLDAGKLLIQQVKNSTRTPLLSVLLHGPSSSGKTALAATLALGSEFPFVKLISPDHMLGFNEASKCSYITKVFNDAYRSPLSVIVVDSIERILDYVPIGPRFSNTVLQTLLVLLTKPPPIGRKLLILATSSRKFMLHDMDFDDAFSVELLVTTIDSVSAIQIILTETQAFPESDIEAILDSFNRRLASDLIDDLSSTGSPRLSIGIKKLLMLIERARQEHPDSRVASFVSYLTDEAIVRRTSSRI